MDSLFKIAFNIGQSNSSISEIVKDIFIPLFSVFLGAVFAHYFNIWYDKKNTYDKNKSQLIYLHNKLLTIYMDLKLCNKNATDKISLLEKFKLIDVVNNTFTTTFEINIKFEEFNFLSKYNKLFVVIIQMLKDRLKELNIYLSDCSRYSESIRLNWHKNIEYELPITSQLNTYLNEIKDFSEDLLGLLHILLNGLDLCYKNYFNESFDFYDLSSNYLEDSFFDNNQLYKSNKENFSKAWSPKHNLKTDIKRIEFKVKKIINDIKMYFR